MALPVTDKINKAAYLLSKVSIFDMPPDRVFTYAKIDCALHGKQEVDTWATTINQLDSLCVAKSPSFAANAKFVSAVMAVKDLVSEQHFVNAAPQIKPPAYAEVKTASKWTSPFAAIDYSTLETKLSSTMQAAVSAGPAPVLPTAFKSVFSSKISAADYLLNPYACGYQVMGDTVLVKNPYNVAVKEAFNTLPKSDRKWDGELKVWRIRIIHLATVVKVLNDNFPGKVHEAK